ncbi:MAG: branched-chain amino acid ABC transporter permease [Fusobacteriaceae bacterium]|jgi:branched-chain amino acid transport system permease protein|nr:branched-chain amino acid ABC transporter permease [Fusobacteriaceae bacterium]
MVIENNMSDTKRHLINFLAVAAIFAIIVGLKQTGRLSPYIQGIMMTTCIAIVMSTSLNLATGFLGQVTLGHAGFMSIGAYTSAIVTCTLRDAGILTGSAGADITRFLFGMLCGGVLAAIFGVFVGIPALRLKGDYLAIITLGFGEIIRVVIQNMEITRKGRSYIGIDSLSNLYVVFWVMVTSVSVIYALVNSKYGRAFMSIREDEVASGASGINTTYYKVLAFTISAFFAGVGGTIYAHYIVTLQPSTFNFSKSTEYMIIVVLGGRGSLTGSVVAAVFLTALPELLRTFSTYRMLAYSVALVFVMIYKPGGVFGSYEFSLVQTLRKFFGKKAPAVKAAAETTGEGDR